MAEIDKIPKSAVLYIHLQKQNYKCNTCIFRRDQANKCALYGSAVAIKPWGGCGEFIFFRGTIAIPYFPAGKYTKENTGYVENPEGFTCGRCDEFLSDKNDCKKIDKNSPGDDPGEILSGACCNRWEKILSNEK